VVGLVVVAVPIVFVALGDGASSERGGVRTDALATVRAAVGQTFAAGSYEMDTVSISSQPSTGSCDIGGRPTPGLSHSASKCVTVSRGGTEFSSHSIVNLEPYAMVARSTSPAYGLVTLHVNSTHVWQLGAATVGYGPGTPGILLSDYSRQVLGSIGRGPGALAMISIASRGGYLNLEEEAVATAEPAGTGTVGDVAVTYYDVSIDIRKLADAANLSDVQRQTIAAALPLLDESGYTATTERIGVDSAGYVRSVDATTSFEDGSSMVRHSVLSNFGCAPKVTMPNQTPEPAPTTPCPPESTTTTTSVSNSVPTTAVPTTSVPATSLPDPQQPTNGPPPADEDAARREVIQAFVDASTSANSMETRLAAIEDGDAIGPLLAQAREAGYRTFGDAIDNMTVTVHDVRFLDATHAVAVTTLHIPGHGDVYANKTEYAVYVDGRWKVSRDSWCARMAPAVSCPPP
jgi:hypothetical protein